MDRGYPVAKILNSPGVRLHQIKYALDQRRFARTVLSDYADYLPAVQLKGDVRQHTIPVVGFFQIADL